MAKEPLESLKRLRDHMVQERRNLVENDFADLEPSRESIGEFMGLQQFIDTIERAMAHEVSLERPEVRFPTSRLS